MVEVAIPYWSGKYNKVVDEWEIKFNEITKKYIKSHHKGKYHRVKNIIVNLKKFVEHLDENLYYMLKTDEDSKEVEADGCNEGCLCTRATILTQLIYLYWDADVIDSNVRMFKDIVKIRKEIYGFYLDVLNHNYDVNFNVNINMPFADVLSMSENEYRWKFVRPLLKAGLNTRISPIYFNGEAIQNYQNLIQDFGGSRFFLSNMKDFRLYNDTHNS